MKNLSELYDKLGSTPMSVLSARPGSLMIDLLSHFIVDQGIRKNKTITIYMKENQSWMTTHILSALTHVAYTDARLYISPLDQYSISTPQCETSKIVSGIEKLFQSDITIEDLNLIAPDYTESIVEFEEETSHPSDIIIFYEIENLFEQSPYSPREILSMLERLTKNGTKIVMLAKMERQAEKKSVSNFENIHNYSELKNFVGFSLIIHRLINMENGNSKALVTTTEGEFEIIKDEDTSFLEG